MRHVMHDWWAKIGHREWRKGKQTSYNHIYCTSNLKGKNKNNKAFSHKSDGYNLFYEQPDFVVLIAYLLGLM